ncbi:MAG: RluA family pseudouridine synthase [Chromatiales bacterium]|jgi:23S rRNA pseudouridine955/2504/2580 synthase|nr:RluA family pseudouridine synthase [Chromatiales bacterium]
MTNAAPRAQAARVTATADHAGRRLDNFLLHHLKGVPRSRVYRLIRSGEVRVNSRRVDASYRLCEGDDVRVPPVSRAPEAQAAAVSPQRAAWIEERVIAEERDFLVLDKPAGLAVHGGSGISLGAIELLRAARGLGDSLSLAHRLDRETSGCLLVAKRASALRDLHAQFRNGEVGKRYLALLVGRWPGRARTVDAPLETTERRGGERFVRVDAAGKPARTHFIPLERFPGAALMAVDLDTGRTHQIRVHAASIGHPVAGDQRYGQADDPIVAGYGLQRLFLHARSLTFRVPGSDRSVTVEAPLDPGLEAVLGRLRAAVPPADG